MGRGLWGEIHTHLIGHRLKKDGRSRDFLLVCHEPVGQMAPIGKIQAHDAPVRFHQGGVHCEVCRGACKGQPRGGLITSAPRGTRQAPECVPRPPTRRSEHAWHY